MVDYKKFNIKDELDVINKKDKSFGFRLETITEELNDIQANIQGITAQIRRAHQEYESAKQVQVAKQVDWIWINGSTKGFVSDLKGASDAIENGRRKLDTFKGHAERLTNERKNIRAEREELAMRTGVCMRMINLINKSDRIPLITQLVSKLDEMGSNKVLLLKVNVYYKDYSVHSKIDMYYKNNGTWYLDKIDVSRKVTSARSSALEKIINDYKKDKK